MAAQYRSLATHSVQSLLADRSHSGEIDSVDVRASSDGGDEPLDQACEDDGVGDSSREGETWHSPERLEAEHDWEVRVLDGVLCASTATGHAPGLVVGGQVSSLYPETAERRTSHLAEGKARLEAPVWRSVKRSELLRNQVEVRREWKQKR